MGVSITPLHIPCGRTRRFAPTYSLLLYRRGMPRLYLLLMGVSITPLRIPFGRTRRFAPTYSLFLIPLGRKHYAPTKLQTTKLPDY